MAIAATRQHDHDVALGCGAPVRWLTRLLTLVTLPPVVCMYSVAIEVVWPLERLYQGSKGGDKKLAPPLKIGSYLLASFVASKPPLLTIQRRSAVVYVSNSLVMLLG